MFQQLVCDFQHSKETVFETGSTNLNYAKRYETILQWFCKFDE